MLNCYNMPLNLYNNFLMDISKKKNKYIIVKWIHSSLHSENLYTQYLFAHTINGT